MEALQVLPKGPSTANGQVPRSSAVARVSDASWLSKGGYKLQQSRSDMAAQRVRECGALTAQANQEKLTFQNESHTCSLVDANCSLSTSGAGFGAEAVQLAGVF